MTFVTLNWLNSCIRFMTASLISRIFTVLILKHNLVYFKPRVQTSAGKKSLMYREIDLWEKIKTEEKELSWVSFKKKTKPKTIENSNASL